MISKASIRNFKSLRDVQIELERFTVFVGPNASGKSSILQAMDLLCQAFRPAIGVHPFGGMGLGGTSVQDVEGELSQGMSRGSKGSVELAAEARASWYRYRTRPVASP